MRKQIGKLDTWLYAHPRADFALTIALGLIIAGCLSC